MLFNSYEFIFIFLPFTLVIYTTLCKFSQPNRAIVFLTLASLAFYAYWDPANLLVLIPSILFNYTLGKSIIRHKHRWLVCAGVSVNLLVLAYFKYASFFTGILNDTGLFSLALPETTLPLGISFFTFTQIAYLVDTYRRETVDCTMPQYGLFVTIFPHLIAGPVLDYKKMIPQFTTAATFVFSHKNFALGLFWFSAGLFKKVIIADSIAPLVTTLFSQAQILTFLEAWTAAIGYSLQLFFDFSGYSEMAVGLGLMLNITLPINFNSPYQACSISDFWRRWHISLSAFLKNYLYIPLGGNRRSALRANTNLMVTMLLGGLWHGAGWQFIIWGGLHGIFLVANRLWSKTRIKLPKAACWTITMLCVVVAWVFFRANTVSDALAIAHAMFDISHIAMPGGGICEAVFGHFNGFILFSDHLTVPAPSSWLNWITAFTVLGLFKSTQEYATMFKPNAFWALVVIFLFMTSLANLSAVSEFLYFLF